MSAFHSSSSSSSYPFDFSTILVNVYTWVAVITAAFSLWLMIRSAASNSLLSSWKLIPVPPPETAAGDEIEHRRPDSTRPSASVVVVPKRLSESTEKSAISSTRRKFKEYYHIDCNEDDDDSCSIGELPESSFRRIDGYRLSLPMEWEKLFRTKMGELSWYRFQDLTVFDGNIVNFWTAAAGDLHR